MEPASFPLLVESGKRWYGAIALRSLSLFAGRFPALCGSVLTAEIPAGKVGRHSFYRTHRNSVLFVLPPA